MSSDIQKNVEPIVETPIVKYIGSMGKEFKPRTNCKTCMSQFRQEAEEQYEKTQNMTAAHNYLIKKGESVTYLAFRNHIIYHYKKHEINMRLKEWAEDIPAFVAQDKNKKATLEERIAILNQQLMIIASQSDNTSLDEKRKSAEATRKLSESILLHEKKIDEMDQAMEPVFIIIEKLKDIVSIRIKNSNNEEIKRELMTVLEQLIESVKDLRVEKSDE